jgi:AraC-like DNA-binding protein
MRLAVKVRKFLKGKDLSQVSVSDIYYHLGLSDKVASRRLQKEGVNCALLLKEEKMQRCVVAMRKDTSISDWDLATLCGYHNERSFLVTFRGWFGITLRRWRKKHLLPEGSTYKEKEEFYGQRQRFLGQAIN